MKKHKKVVPVIIILAIAVTGSLLLYRSFAATDQPQEDIGTVQNISNASSDIVNNAVNAVSNQLESKAKSAN